MVLTINFERFKANFNELAAIGKKDDGGIYRMAFNADELLARDWLEAKLEAYGIPTRRDAALNIIGRYENEANQDKPAVVIGSHIDTVPNAGALDGALGVLVGLECLLCIKEQSIQTTYPLEVIAFSDEEGRFGGMFGSRAFAGQLNPRIIEESQDLDGIMLSDVLQQLGVDPYQALSASRPKKEIKSYLELHIEQGPVLDAENVSVGIVSDITGLFKWQVRLLGAANHAGTTPMEMRKDAFMGLADFAHEIPRIIDENGGEASRITIGNVALYPGSANTVPGEVDFSIDARDVSLEVMNELKDACRKALSAIARRRQLSFDFTEASMIYPVACDNQMQSHLEEAAQQLEMSYKVMPSGAAHDAQMVAKIAPIAMIFVPSKNGISHSPHEWTDWHHLESGANLALNALVRIAGDR
ncbi:Zn-dependent hydrolase [Reichenbachiella agariperforans]|uniref:Zn-dependent hydrolase n=1 Tax=Reichenbachiella agariperforans TaxID=156994 RepID=UPI001C095D60|nr:Zn-dependent hydrolase [Reichenbachiella agariperforans]MBU2913095.1 Zn-dependent hydrolase [Reichenbachiella agariperforans]